MLIQKIKWWLWNQMFQYAYIKALSLRVWVPFLLDTMEYDYYKYRDYELFQLFDIKWKYAKKNDLKFYQKLYSKNKYLNFLCTKIKDVCIKFNPHHYVEKNMFDNNGWDASIIDDKFLNIKAWYIEGYFQSLKYFVDYEDIIKEDFMFKKSLSKRSDEIKKMIENSESVSIHVRRWDYLNKECIDTYWVCDIDYFNNWVKVIEGKIKKTLKFFVFSDDIPWCEENIKLSNIHFIDRNQWKDSWQDLYLMSCCKHNIIANSSFSWWWAELNSNVKKIVIAPRQWYKKINVYQNDIVPDSWIRI